MNEERSRESIFELLKKLEAYSKIIMLKKLEAYSKIIMQPIQCKRIVYPVLKREEVIDYNDILNLKIALNTSKSIEQFLAITWLFFVFVLVFCVWWIMYRIIIIIYFGFLDKTKGCRFNLSFNRRRKYEKIYVRPIKESYRWS